MDFHIELEAGQPACLRLRWQDGPTEWGLSRLLRELDAPGYVHLARAISPAVFAQAVLCDLHREGRCSDAEWPLFGCLHPTEERPDGSRDAEDLLLCLTRGELPAERRRLLDMGVFGRDASLLEQRAQALVAESSVERCHLASRNLPPTSVTVLRWLRLRFEEIGGLAGLDTLVTASCHHGSGSGRAIEPTGSVR